MECGSAPIFLLAKLILIALVLVACCRAQQQVNLKVKTQQVGLVLINEYALDFFLYPLAFRLN